MNRRTRFHAFIFGLLLLGTGAQQAFTQACPKPQNLHETNLTASSVTVHWDAVPGATGYELTGGIAGFPSTFIPPISVVGQNNTSLSVSALCMDRSYEWSVRAICDDTVAMDTIQSGFAPSSIFTTGSCGTPAPASTIVNGSSATLMWNQAVNAIGYEVTGQQQGGPTVKILRVGATNTQLTINNLPAANFLWQVAAICAVTTVCIPGFNYGGTSADAFTIVGNSDKAWNGNLFDPQYQPSIRSFPNPSEGNFRVEINDLLQEGRLIIYDFLGRQVMQKQVAPADQAFVDIDLAGSKSGTYLIRLVSGNRQTTDRVVVQ